MRRSCFQFSLRTLLLFTVLTSLTMAAVVWWRTPRLARDVEARMRQDFPPDQHRQVRRILLAYDTDFPRMHRCFLHVAQGDMNRLKEIIEVAEFDYRDAIVRAEYQGPDHTRIYDFGRTFDKASDLPIEP
jgi:hypothetical protein